MPEFVHLHSHTCYSLLDGLARIDDLLQATVDAGMPALALTDHGTMFATIEFYSRAKVAGVKPIVGCEVYVSDRPLADRPGSGSENYHLVLLAENETGYRNLIRLTTEAHVRGFYRKPRVDNDLLERHSDGLVCLSACASGELAARILKGDEAGAEELADWYRQAFPGRYYLEVQNHSLDFDSRLNEGIIRTARRLDLPLVATNDVHYVHQRQAHAHEILLCIQTQTTLTDPKRMRLETPEFYLKTPEQMCSLFGHLPETLTNTLAIAERCNLELTFGRPAFPTAGVPAGKTATQHLRDLCQEGMLRRYPSATAEQRERLEYELAIIERTGFVEYILLVHDVIDFARKSGIAVGPGRGSAAGSIVAYCLLVTNVDPVALGLSFERFLNPERVTMPDMDLDFADDRRDEVIRYVTEKYGRDRVAQIITFGTIKPRAGVRDVGRVLGVSPGDIDLVAKLVPFMSSKMVKAREDVPELQRLYETDPTLHEVMDVVEDLEGVARHASTHPAGIVISRDPLIDQVPLYKVPKSEAVTTQYAMTSIEEIGLLKMDFLGLRTLTILERACTNVRHSGGSTLTPDDIPLDDPCIYDLLSSGDTFGVFQVDGQGMRKFIKQLRPTEFEHVVALLAMYRPGPMDFIEEFAARKNGERGVSYDHPALEEVLKSTYGIVVYQEQVMKLAVVIAGYTMGEGDLLRKAMGKKKPEELAKHRDQFIRRAAERGTSAEVAARLFTIMEPFAGYAFNKAHSAAYAVITCQTAYLKARYPREFMAAYLSAEKENAETVAAALSECRRLGVDILSPDVNQSGADFSIEAGGIRFGLSAIKNAGAGAVESLLDERRNNGPFASLEEFCRRVDWNGVNKRALESFFRCGALDSLGIDRARLLASLDRLVAFAAEARRAAAAGQASLFGEEEQPPALLALTGAEPAALEDKLAWEHELLGTAISRHPVLDAEPQLLAVEALPVAMVSAAHYNKQIRIGGLIRALRSSSTKAGKPMASFTVTDLQASVEALVFSRNYDSIFPRLEDGSIAVVDGKLDANDGRIRLLVDAVFSLAEAAAHPFSPASRRNGRQSSATNGNGSGTGNGSPADPPDLSPHGRRLTVELRRSSDRSADIERVVAVYATLQRFPGKDEVEIVVRNGGRVQTVPLPNRTTAWCDALETELRGVVGDGRIRVATPGGSG